MTFSWKLLVWFRAGLDRVKGWDWVDRNGWKGCLRINIWINEFGWFLSNEDCILRKDEGDVNIDIVRYSDFFEHIRQKLMQIKDYT